MIKSNINKVTRINCEIHDFFTKNHDDIEIEAGYLIEIISAIITSNNEDEFFEKTKSLFNKMQQYQTNLKTESEPHNVL